MAVVVAGAVAGALGAEATAEAAGVVTAGAEVGGSMVVVSVPGRSVRALRTAVGSVAGERLSCRFGVVFANKVRHVLRCVTDFCSLRYSRREVSCRGAISAVLYTGSIWLLVVWDDRMR